MKIRRGDHGMSEALPPLSLWNSDVYHRSVLLGFASIGAGSGKSHCANTVRDLLLETNVGKTPSIMSVETSSPIAKLIRIIALQPSRSTYDRIGLSVQAWLEYYKGGENVRDEWDLLFNEDRRNRFSTFLESLGIHEKLRELGIDLIQSNLTEAQKSRIRLSMFQPIAQYLNTIFGSGILLYLGYKEVKNYKQRTDIIFFSGLRTYADYHLIHEAGGIICLVQARPEVIRFRANQAGLSYTESAWDQQTPPTDIPFLVIPNNYAQGLTGDDERDETRTAIMQIVACVAERSLYS